MSSPQQSGSGGSSGSSYTGLTNLDQPGGNRAGSQYGGLGGLDSNSGRETTTSPPPPPPAPEPVKKVDQRLRHLLFLTDAEMESLGLNPAVTRDFVRGQLGMK